MRLFLIRARVVLEILGLAFVSGAAFWAGVSVGGFGGVVAFIVALGAFVLGLRALVRVVRAAIPTANVRGW